MSKIGNNLIKQYFGKTSSMTADKKTISSLIDIISSIAHVHDFKAQKEEILQEIAEFQNDLSLLKINYSSPSPGSATMSHIKSIVGSLKQLIPHMRDEGLHAEDRTGAFMTGVGLINQLQHVLEKV
jgi:hypothetical protein